MIANPYHPIRSSETSNSHGFFISRQSDWRYCAGVRGCPVRYPASPRRSPRHTCRQVPCDGYWLLRICDIGGWTDTWFYPNGAIFNICVDLYSNIRIIPTKNNMIQIYSENLNLTTEINDFKQIKYDGTLDLLKAAVKRMGINEGMTINVRTEAPPGCGTGTSASVAVALIAALSQFSNIKLNPNEIAELAHKLETEELNLESGVQDQYAAALGGINFMEITYPSVKITPIRIKKKRIYELENQMILVF